VLATQVQRQYREIGIRIALGASISGVVRKLLVECLLIVGAGAAVGIAVALTIAPLLEHQLYKVRAIDIPSFALALLLLVIAALVALLPSVLRVARVNPVDILRVE
jgi:ABC-type antimicrobial peptide transport system permease subunit